MSGHGRFFMELETAPGPSAVVVAALVGPGAPPALAHLTPDRAPPRMGVPKLLALQFAGEHLDDALVLVRGPQRVELHLHGGPAVWRDLRRALLSLGGEERAPEGLEARAVAALPRAPSVFTASALLSQAQGALRRELSRLCLLGPGPFRAGVLVLCDRGRALVGLLRPPRVLLFGPPNGGKSTLFNLLVGSRRALVSPEPGTTRDVLEAEIELGEHAISLVDVAGERESSGPWAAVERAGQALAWAEAERADLVLWLSPADRPTPPPPKLLGRAVVLTSRADLAPGSEGLSVRSDPEGARRAVLGRVAAELGLGASPGDPWPAGLAAPFEVECIRALESLAELPGTAARAQSLARILGPRSRPWWDC